MNLIDSVQHINFSGKSASKRSIGFNSIVIVTGALIVAFSISCFSQPLAKGKDKYLGNVLTTTLYSNFPDYWNLVMPESGEALKGPREAITGYRLIIFTILQLKTV
jgi:hypothetical protein